MRGKAWISVAVLLTCAGLLVAAIAWASVPVTIKAKFNPDRLGQPTSLSATGVFGSSGTAPPAPISNLTVYAPAGMKIDLSGSGTCIAARLQARGPSGCPADSRAGFGGGVALLALGDQVIHERYTLDFFVAPRQNGRLILLAYVNAATPASFQLVVVAKETQGSRPYGLGFSIDVPPIPTLPAASNASVGSAFLTFGATNVAYYKRVHGKQTLVHVRGVVVPDTCPRGGFPIEGKFDFADGTTTTTKASIPCPRNP